MSTHHSSYPQNSLPPISFTPLPHSKGLWLTYQMEIFRGEHSRWRKKGKWPPIMRPTVQTLPHDKGVKMK